MKKFIVAAVIGFVGMLAVSAETIVTVKNDSANSICVSFDGHSEYLSPVFDDGLSVTTCNVDNFVCIGDKTIKLSEVPTSEIKDGELLLVIDQSGEIEI